MNKTHLLLKCGILASVLYVVMFSFLPLLYEGYNIKDYTVSELSAIDAPTRNLWLILAAIYTLLMLGFGLGLKRSSEGRRPLRIMAGLMIFYGIFGLFWPPMHRREILAAGGASITDQLHVAFTIVTVPLMLLMLGAGALGFKGRFRWHSILSILALAIFGSLTASGTSNMEQDLPTPWMGVWERVCISIFLLWVSVLSIVMLRRHRPATERWPDQPTTHPA